MAKSKNASKPATRDSISRDANLAAAVVALAMVMQDVLTTQGIDVHDAVRRLKGCEETAFGCIPASEQEHFGQALAGIHAYVPPPPAPTTSADK